MTESDLHPGLKAFLIKNGCLSYFLENNSNEAIYKFETPEEILSQCKNAGCNVINLFKWTDTEQGHEFWENIHDGWAYSQSKWVARFYLQNIKLI